LVGAPTVVLAAAPLAVAGQDASVPDGFDWAAPTAVLAAAEAALTAATVPAAPVALAAPGDLAELAPVAEVAEVAAWANCGTPRATSSVAAVAAVRRKRRETPLFIQAHPQYNRNGTFPTAQKLLFSRLMSRLDAARRDL
jgi:hypothetical protein